MSASRISMALVLAQICKKVFSLQFVATPPSGFHNTVASVLDNQICRLLSIIKSLVVLLFSLKPFMS